MQKKLSTLYYKSSWLKSCTAVVVEHIFLFTFTPICHRTTALVSGNVKKSKYLDIVIFLHSEHLLIIFRFLGWRHLPVPRGRTSLRFLKGTKITVHELLTKRRFRKTRNAIIKIFLRWQLTPFFNWKYNCLRTGLCTNILCYCFLASCWKSSYNYILVILPNDKGAIWRVLNVKLKKSRTFQAKYFHNTEESIMVAMINKSVLREICRACATHETASLRQLSIDHIVNVLYKRCGLAKTRLRHPSLPFDSLPYPTHTICRRVRTYARSITWQPNEKKLTIFHEYGALSHARFVRVGAPQ